MPATRQIGSISRTLLLPSENQGTIRLRYQLAEDGCKESQVALAKCLLTSPINNLEDRSFNAQLAVYWLLQAASKGQEEALALLRDCVTAGVGINTRNSYEIEKCLKYSETEITSRKVAFSIFRAIMSDTETSLAEDLFREKIDELLKSDIDEHFLSDLDEGPTPAMEKLSPSKEKITPSKEKFSPSKEKFTPTKQTEDVNIQSQPHISFTEVVNSVQTCLEGNVPIVSLKHVTEFGEQKKWLFVKYTGAIKNLIVKATEDLIQSFSHLNILISILLLCIFVNFVSSFTTPGTEFNIFIHNCNLFLATLLCLSALLSSTCYVICISLGVENMQKWLHLIKIFEPNVKSNEVERKYLMKTAYPFLTFLVTSAIYLMMLPLNNAQHSFTDLGILALILMLFVDRTISYSRYHVNISLFLNGLTCLYKSNLLQSYSNVLSYLNFSIIYEIGMNYRIHLSFISCIALPFVLPYLYLKMALRNEGKGWHLVLLPHLMSVSWMNFACLHLGHVDNSSNLISSLSCCLLIIFMSRYFGFVITFTLYVIIKAIIASGYINVHLILFMPVFGVMYALSLFCVRKFKLSYDSKVCSLVICILIAVLTYQAGKPQSLKTDDLSNSVLPWEKYQTHCHYNAWYKISPAEVQIACLPFKGRKIAIDGSVTNIELTQIKNSLQTVANVLPNPFSEWFTCLFGSRYTLCDAENLSPADKANCLLRETLNITSCHLHNWDEYKYQITVEVSSRTSPEVILRADHICSPFVRSLKEGDSLRVVGILEENMGGLLPTFHLNKGECTSCYSRSDCITSVSLPRPSYSNSIKNIVWFYLSPFIQYAV